HVPAGSSILVESYTPWVDVERYQVEGVGALSSIEDPGALRWSYLVASEEMWRRAYLAEGDPRREVYDRLFGVAVLVAGCDGVGPTSGGLRVPAALLAPAAP